MFHPQELVHWFETATNRAVIRPHADRDFWSLFREDDVVLDKAPVSLTRAEKAPCDLLIVLTTFARPELCLRKLQSLPSLLAAHGANLKAHVLVLRDACSKDYSQAKDEAYARFGDRVTFLEAEHHLGKAGYWKTYQTAFLAAKHLKPKHCLFLQDDVQYTRQLLRDSYDLWERTGSDPNRRVVYLFSSEDDEPEGRWVRFKRQDLPDGKLRLTQWFDLQAYFVDLRFFEALDFRIVPVHSNRFRRRPSLSSGVGAQLTRRLFGRCNVYQATLPLVLHGAHPSVMNPEARAARSLDNLRMASLFAHPVIG